MVIDPPPAGAPAAGLRPVTVGSAAYVNWSAGLTALVPRGVVTVTSTTPALPAGMVAVMVVALTTAKVAAVAPVKLVPVTVTAPPPAVAPTVGLRPVTAGGDI